MGKLIIVAASLTVGRRYFPFLYPRIIASLELAVIVAITVLAGLLKFSGKDIFPI